MKRVLVVEDDPHLRRVYRTLLSSEGFAVLEASNGEEGAAAAAAEPVDCIVADTMMPVLSGIGMLQRLAREGRTVKAILVSAMHPLPEPSELRQIGVERVFGKPFAFDQLIRAVHEVCGSDERDA